MTAYHRAGIAALHIEDQVASKRCGHLDSKQLVETNGFLARIAAATAARDQLPGDPKDKIMIIARTDCTGREWNGRRFGSNEKGKGNGRGHGLC